MKKIISLMLILATAFALTAMLTSCNGQSEDAAYGVVEADGKTYFVADGGALVIENGVASATSDVSGTPESKKFNAHETTGDYFTYTEVQGKINITGLTETGKAQSVIVLPEKIDGKAVVMVSAGAFDGLQNLVIATMSASVTIADGGFKGVKNVFVATTADLVSVSANLLTDSNGTTVYISADEFSNFKSHYNWGNLASYLNKF